MRRNLGMIAAIAATALSMPAMAASPQPVVLDNERPSRPARKEKQRAMVAQAQRRYSSKGPQAKPKKRRNMRHVSKRVRRQHRRAA